MKADVSNYDANIAKARRTLEGFKQDNLTFGGVLNQSTKSIVAAAAQYASFAAVLGTVASGFAEAVSRGTEMAREMEGVKMAFDRLNQPGLLDNLREATHNTVNDLELMKQAVKFDNFNLSIEQMGTFLAFAQQQAKDTGQDVNYLVDSIVTGLGRKSLPILDNLGLSAEEIRNRMKETGDMTTAVAQIIQERMEAAGGYVETAADRAAQAQVRLDNAMTELGNTMNSLTGTGATLWTELEIGAVNLANNAIKPLIKLFNELANYINGTSAEDILTRGMTDVTDTVDDNGRLIRKNAINKIPEITVTGNAPKVKPRTGGNTTKTEQTEFQKNQQKINTLTQEYVKISDNANDATRARQDEIQKEIQQLQQRNNLLKLYAEQAQGKLQGGDIQTDGLTGPNFRGFADLPSIGKGLSSETIEKVREAMKPENRAQESMARDLNKFTGYAEKTLGGVSSIVGGMSQLGVEIPKGLQDVLGGIQGIISITTGIASIVAMIETLNAVQTTESSIKSIPGIGWLLAGGGIIHAANGYVPGNNYSGDQVPALLNSGELVLNKAQQNALANELQGNGMQNMRLRTEVSGRNLIVVIENDLKARGKGQLATFKG